MMNRTLNLTDVIVFTPSSKPELRLCESAATRAAMEAQLPVLKEELALAFGLKDSALEIEASEATGEGLLLVQERGQVQSDISYELYVKIDLSEGSGTPTVLPTTGLTAVPTALRSTAPTVSKSPTGVPTVMLTATPTGTRNATRATKTLSHMTQSHLLTEPRDATQQSRLERNLSPQDKRRFEEMKAAGMCRTLDNEDATAREIFVLGLLLPIALPGLLLTATVFVYLHLHGYADEYADESEQLPDQADAENPGSL